MNLPRTGLLGTGLLLAVTIPGLSQRPDPTRLGEATRPLSVPTLQDQAGTEPLGLEDENAFAPPSPGDDDLGQQLILKEAPKNRWLSAQVDAFSYWTDNPANLPESGEDDVFWGGRVSLIGQPRIASRLYGDVMVGQQIYRYDRFDLLDYEFFEASIGLVYVGPASWTRFFSFRDIQPDDHR